MHMLTSYELATYIHINYYGRNPRVLFPRIINLKFKQPQALHY